MGESRDIGRARKADPDGQRGFAGGETFEDGAIDRWHTTKRYHDRGNVVIRRRSKSIAFRPGPP
jgi:hypothetical protein